MFVKKLNQIIALLKEYVKINFSISLFVFLFVLFFQPFTTEKFGFENKLLFVSGSGGILFLSLMLSQILFQDVFKKDCSAREENTSLYYFAMFTLWALSSLGLVFYLRYVGEVDISFIVAIKVVIICVSPVVVLNVRYTIQQLNEKYCKLFQKYRELQNKSKHFSETYSKKIIELTSENDADDFRLQIADLVYVKSADNYVEIGYREANVLKKKLIRNTLKNIEQQLKEFNNFIRTHRTAIVNIQFIDKLNKNYNSYWISLADTHEIIPVARQYLMVIKGLL